MDYVSIPGFETEFRNREGISGGGVGVYIKENIIYKRRRGIENAHPELEHVWIEVPGRNKCSRALVGVMYISERILGPFDWLNSLENLLGYLTVYWDGMLMLTGDINIDMLRPSDHLTKRVQGILDMFELTQIVKRPTRVTRTSKTLIDHFITNHLQKVTNTGIIPCSIVSTASMYGSLGSSLVINFSGTLGTLKRTCLERTFLLFLCLLYPTRMIQTNNWRH